MTRSMGARWAVAAFMLAAALVTAAVTPQPAAAQSYQIQPILHGEIVSAQPVMIQDRPSGRGAATGSTVGAIAGAAIADRRDGLLGALVGGAIGGAIGRAADRAGSTKRGTELIIRLDSGEELAIQIPGELEYLPGDRVRLTVGPNGTQVTRVRE